MKKAWDPDRWTYSVDEIRNGLYVALADDHQGTQLKRQGWVSTDDELESLITAVKDDAADITRRRRGAAGRG